MNSYPVRLEGWDVDVLVHEHGTGPVLLLLPGMFGVESLPSAVGPLAEQYRVIVPVFPAFDGTTRPLWCTTAEDLAYMCLDLVEQLRLDDVVLVGCSFGGWVAAEVALRRPNWLRRLILVDAVGIRVGERGERDILDLYATEWSEIIDRAFHKSEIGSRFLGVSDKSRSEIETIAINQEALIHYSWQPYLHDPKLRRRLHLITAPTVVVWGAEDGIVASDYGRAFADAIPGARFVEIASAGHLPHIEQPAKFLTTVRADLDDRVGAVSEAS